VAEGSGITLTRQQQLIALFGENNCLTADSVIDAIYEDIVNNNRFTDADIDWLYSAVNVCKTESSGTLGKDEAVVYRIIDGDTIDLLACPTMSCVLGELAPTTVRLWKVDASEIGSDLGKRAADYLKDTIPPGTFVTYQYKDRDSFGRKVVVVYKGTTNINDQLIARGLAIEWNYTDWSKGDDDTSNDGDTGIDTDGDTTAGAAFKLYPDTFDKPDIIQLGKENWFSIQVENIGDEYGKAYLGIRLADEAAQVYEYPGDSNYAKGFQPGVKAEIKAKVPVPGYLAGNIRISAIVHQV